MTKVLTRKPNPTEIVGKWFILTNQPAHYVLGLFGDDDMPGVDRYVLPVFARKLPFRTAAAVHRRPYEFSRLLPDGIDMGSVERVQMVRLYPE